jgi:hypothetical protein
MWQVRRPVPSWLDLKELHDPVSVVLDDLVGRRDHERAVAGGDLKSRRDLTDHLPYRFGGDVRREFVTAFFW